MKLVRACVRVCVGGEKQSADVQLLSFNNVSFFLKGADVKVAAVPQVSTRSWWR